MFYLHEHVLFPAVQVNVPARASALPDMEFWGIPRKQLEAPK